MKEAEEGKSSENAMSDEEVKTSELQSGGVRTSEFDFDKRFVSGNLLDVVNLFELKETENVKIDE
jgi:hypothetical protein